MLNKKKFYLLASLFLMWVPVQALWAYAVDEDSMLFEAEDAYQAVVSADSATELDVCFAERHLARVKLIEKEALELSAEDVERLNEKSNRDCEEPVDEGYAGPYYKKTTAGDDQNQYIKIASEISNNDLDFILTLEQENGLWTPERLHGYNRNGTSDHGFCGLNSAYHWNYIQSEAFKDPRNQLEYCYNIFKQKPGRFYGYFKRFNHRWKFEYVGA